MADFPLRVEVNEDNILKLTDLYRETYKQIVQEIETATDFGKANRREILSQIEVKLTKLGVDTQKFLEKELPDYYKQGANQAVGQLKDIKAPIRVALGFSKLHESAVVALIDDTSRAFGEGLSGVKRSANLLLNRAVKNEITFRLAGGEIAGEALVKTRQAIKGILQEQGLSALKDKAGRSWSLDLPRIARTETVSVVHAPALLS